uniref:Uncharacterized protein n=1 Tax=Anguilla anguilla TaxID=7936 RepID=A0A0E9SMT8_ANGAN
MCLLISREVAFIGPVVLCRICFGAHSVLTVLWAVILAVVFVKSTAMFLMSVWVA